MRRVALLFALLFAVAAIPQTQAADDCASPAGLNGICVKITQTERPSSPPGVPAVPPTPYWGTYYIFLKPGACTNPLATDCRGVPNSPGSGVKLPAGGAIGVGGGLFGVLWQESNGAPGLQRYPLFPRPGDHMIIV